MAMVLKTLIDHRYGQPGTYSVCLRLDCGDECKKENLLRNSSNKDIFCIGVTVPKPAEGEEVEGEVVLEGESDSRR